MKTMKCSQLGGPENCSKEFHGRTFQEIAQLSQAHGKEMYEKSDTDHLKAMEEMKKLMQDPKAMQNWMASKKEIFDSLPEEN